MTFTESVNSAKRITAMLRAPWTDKWHVTTEHLGGKDYGIAVYDGKQNHHLQDIRQVGRLSYVLRMHRSDEAPEGAIM